MTHELYLNGQAVDIGDADITLEYVSNLLSDIASITGSYSYTIKLPVTQRNRKILDDPTAPSYPSASRGKYMDAVYLRNGLNPIGKCRAILLESGSEYEVALTWGPLAGIEEWAKGSASLRDLPIEETIKWGYPIYTKYDEREAPFIIGKYNPGFDIARVPVDKARLHPATNLYYLFDAVMRLNRISYTLPAGVEDDMKRRAVLLATSNPSDDTLLKDKGITGLKWTLGRELPTSEAVIYFIDSVDPERRLYNLTGSRWEVKDGENNVKIRARFSIPANVCDTVPSIDIKAWYSDTSYVSKKLAYATLQGDSYVFDFEAEAAVDLSQSRYYELQVNGIAKNVSNEDLPDYNNKDDRMEIIILDKEVAYEGTFPLAENLPDMKQADFVKSICWFYAMFATPATNGLAFVQADTLTANKSKTKDWSDKLLDTNGGNPTAISFSFLDFAQQNTLTYKEDSENLGYNASGTLGVDDESLEKEKTVIEMPFAASRDDIVRQYTATYDTDKSEWEIAFNEVEPRLLEIVPLWDELNSLNRCAFRFTPEMDFSNRVQTIFREYQRIIRKPVVITSDFRLNEQDLREMDFTVPVYLSQYGSYFGIVSVKTSAESDICEVKLLKI